MSDQIKLTAHAFYQRGSWYIDIEAPRWFVEALDEIGTKFSRASSRYIGNSGKFSDAGILLRATMNQPATAIKESSMDGLTEGRIVHFVMMNGQHRPAIIVHNWANELTPPCEGYVNLTVFTDWENDFNSMPESVSRNGIDTGLIWVTSICFDDTEKKPGTWHWIEKA